MNFISKDELDKAVKILNEGGVVMHATETCYGLAVDVFDEGALGRLYSLKRMDKGKPVSIMVRDTAEAGKYVHFNDLALELAEKFWPGPLTIVLPRKGILPDFFNPGIGTVGIRCPDSEVSQALIRGFEGPLTTTSANVSGLPEVYSVDEYLKQTGDKRGDKPDFIVDSGEILRKQPSTVVKVTGENLEVIRAGSIDIESLY